MKKIKRAALPTAILAVILMLVIFSCSSSQSSRVISVRKGPFHVKVHTVGQLQSAASHYIGCPPVADYWNFTITFMAPEGKEVKKGDRILRFEERELREKRQVKQSELETSKKELERIRLLEQETLDNMELQLAEAQVNKQKARQKADQPDELLAMNELKKARMDYELAEMQEQMLTIRIDNQKKGMKTRIYAQQAKVKQLEREVKQLGDSIEMMTVKAPKDGMLVYATDWRGRKKAVGDRTWKGSQIMELPNLDRMQVKAVIPEPEAWKIKEGLAVEIRLDSNPDRVFNGKIKSLGRIFHTKSRNQPAMVFDAIIDILDPDPGLMRPGMAAAVDIIVSSKENVLQVPETAIIYEENGLFVLRKTFLSKKSARVSIGRRSSGMVEIISGLDENDRVMIPVGEDGEAQ
jgi:HlyD family secretion protein